MQTLEKCFCLKKIEGETEEYAFDLNEFFATDGKGNFVYEEAVDKFLKTLTEVEKMPFATDKQKSLF